MTLAATQGIAKALVPMGEAYPGAVTEVVMMSPAFGAEQPEAARRFVAAHLRGQRDYYRAFVSGETGDAGKDEIAQVVARYTAVKDPKLFLRIGKHGVDPNGAIDLTVLEDMQQYFLKLGVQNRRMDLGQVIDHRYLDYALERLGKQV